MEWVNFFNTQALWPFIMGMTLLYMGFLMISKKISFLINLQKKTNETLLIAITEIKKSNRILAELAGVEIPEEMFQGSQSESIRDLDSAIKLYIGNVDYAVTESELASHFAIYGQIEQVNIPVNRYTGRARGFGFVTFTSKSDAERAMNLNGTEFRGRQIQVNFAKEREVV